MAIKELNYHYGRQILRYLEQVVRAFSGMEYEANSANGRVRRMVPCEMASKDSLVASINKNGSSNVVNSAPRFSVNMTGFTYDQSRQQDPTHVSSVQVYERERLPDGSGFTGKPGVKYTVDRLMPRPFIMTVQVDIWTTNLDQKCQLVEQALLKSVPSIEIQNSDNALDMSAKTEMILTNSEWTNRSFPLGSDTSLEISTLTFEIRMWLAPPSKVTAIRQIETIHADTSLGGDPSPQVITFGNYRLEVDGDVLTLLTSGGLSVDENGEELSWRNLIDNYGTLYPMSSQIRLSKNLEVSDDDEIIGRVDWHPDPNRLYWTIDPDTLPANTLQPVDRLIDPLNYRPGNELPAAAEGQRYLLAHDVSGMPAWSNITARTGNIIQYNNGQWHVIWTGSDSIQYIVNLHSGAQYKWNREIWVMAIDGVYQAGYWRFIC